MTLYLRGVSTAWRLFGASRHFLFFLFVILGFRILGYFTILTLWLDKLIYPEFQKVKVERPVFIIGHPRSGTTFVHHLFTSTDEMAAFKAWHILFPALSARKLIKPFIRFLSKKQKTEIIPAEAGHRLALDQVEEEEMLFLHIHDTQFVIIATLLGFDDDDFRKIRFHDLQPRRHRIKSTAFLKSCFQRHILYTGKSQIFAQTHFSTHRIKTLMEVFPDARFIYMHRLPDETLPSYFSLNYNTIDVLWGMHRFTPEQKERFFAYRYAASQELYRYFFDLWRNDQIDKRRVLIVPYSKLREDLMGTFERIISFTGITPSNILLQTVQRQAKRQQNYQREHAVNELADFGIDPARLKDDFNFVYDPPPDFRTSAAEISPA